MSSFDDRSPALKALVDGNAEFVQRAAGGAELQTKLDGFKKFQTSQSPKVAVLACADSRVAPELIFNQGIGSLFVVRGAGNLADEYGIASLEFAVAVLGATDILVLGHTGCGAVKASIGEDPEKNPALTPSLKSLCGQIRKGIPKECFASEPDSVRANVFASIENLKERSEALRSAWSGGQLGLNAGVYDLVTGRVEFIREKDNAVS